MNKKAKILILSIVAFASMSSAENVNPTYNSYYEAYKQASGLDDDKLAKFTSDENYKLGMKHLVDETFFDTKKINKTKMYSEELPNFQEVFVPNYNKALKYFDDSARETNNPISSYVGSYIIQSYTNMQNLEYLKMFVDFSKIMYTQEIKICQAYLNYGSVFENGYLTKKDESAALSIYEEGLQDAKCQKGWISSVLNSKILSLKMSKK
ncbi:hypothetical protein ACNSOL_12025 (plasmid) [Aliarcobacter lanthieri]|uniref:hypothetical protein n=1 Tax=Aliarcobacter lanthieri TaxID=1355374 RepID=UPI003AB09CE6